AEIERDRLAKQRQLALDAAKLGWWHYDPVTKVASYDEGYRKIFNVEGERKPNEEILKRLHPDDLPQVWARVEAALDPRDPKPYEAEYRIFLPDGSCRWIEAHGIATFEGAGDERHATSLVGTVADITERKLADSRLRRFFETDLFALLYWQIEGAVLDANDKFLEITGYTREDLRAGRLNWSQMTPPEFHALDDDARRQVRETGMHRPYEKQYVRKDGKRVWILISAAAWGDNPNEGVSFILDITSRKQSEQALRESESKFRSLFDNSLDAIMLTDGDSTIAAANPAACAMFGMTEQEICEYGRDRLVDPADSRLQGLVQQRRTLGIASGELVHVRKDGTRFLAETTSVDLTGEPERAYVSLRDITERKLAEEKVRVSEEKFAAAFEGNPAALTLTRLKDGTFLEVNDTWTKLTQYARYEAIGRSSLELSIWADPEMRKRFVAELTEKGALHNWQAEFKNKSGGSFFAELAAQVLTIGGEEVALSTLIDITERKRAEEQLRLSNERFQVALKSSPVVVFNQDLDLRYTWVYNVLGFAGLDLLGRRDSDVLENPEDAAALEAIKREVINTGVPQRREVLIHLQGVNHFYDLQVEPLRDTAGEIAGITCAAIDITDRKRAEAAMLKSEKLASVGRMAATVAHEINNPLEAVMNSIFLAQIEKSPAEIRKHLKTADEELRRVAHIARQSLGFYRDTTEPSCTSTALVLSSTVDLLKNKIRVKDAAIRKEWEIDLCVHAVPNELRQVFGNLVANSLDAIEHRGIITLRTKRYTRPNGTRWVRILVADNGGGILPEARQHLFEPLFTTKNDVGTGLGLWVSKQIIEKHGGSIRVRSRCEEPGRGTTIVISLPEYVN
ncbi:MAG TPA: PAS domain S-box protein, partial [Candidatus Acidoferrales bacterium]|nr:PAS domain S-box protein [Candidatus Acidoferrales bacterium]